VVILSLIWGLAFVAIRRAVLELSPVSLTLLRWLIASGGFLILAPLIGKPKAQIRKEHVPRILLVAFASVGGYHLSLNYAETIVSSGRVHTCRACSLATAVIWGGRVLIVYQTGRLMDRIGRKSVLLIGIALGCLSLFVMGWAVILSLLELFWISRFRVRCHSAKQSGCYGHVSRRTPR